MGTPAPAQGMPAPTDPQGQSQAQMLMSLLMGGQGTGQAGGGSAAPPPSAGTLGGSSQSQDPWLQMQQQAQDAATAQWGPLAGAGSYQVDPGGVPQQNAGGGYNSGEDWVKNQAAAQAHSDATYGKAPGMTAMQYKDSGPYSPVGDLAANQYVARADQWAANGSGPAIAPAIQQAINEDPRLAGLYANQPIQRINNVGNGFGVLPGALTPGVALHNAGQIPSSYNDLLKHTQANPGSPQGMNNLGPSVAQYMSANPVAGGTEGVNRNPVANSPSYYDYSGPNGSPANSAGAQTANSQRMANMPPQLQMLAKLLMGMNQQSSGGQPGMTAPSAPTPMAPQPMAPSAQAAGNPLLSRSTTALNALSGYR